MKEKRIKHGFSKNILSHKFTVFFEYFGNKITKAHLLLNDVEIYSAVSKCSVDDVYDKNVGESIALQKCLDKYESWLYNYTLKLQNGIERLIDETNDGLMLKLKNIQKKN